MRKLLFLSVAIIGSLILLSCGSTDSKTNYQVSITASPSEGGTVSPTSGEYEEGTSVDISAQPSEEWQFMRWEGGYEGTSSTATITVDSDKNIQGIFAKKEYELTVNTEGEGTVDESVLQTTSATDYESGTIVELTANPAEEWKFVEWQGDVTSNENPTQITVNEAKQVTAVFEKRSYELTVNTEGEGTVDESVVQTTSTADYDSGTIVELTANPAEGWKFVEWQGDISTTENPVQITVNEAKKVTAVFEKKSFAVNINTEGEGSVTKNPDQENYIFQSSLELVATPATGYQFIEWRGDIESTENQVTVTVDTDPNFTAVFEKENYSLTTNTEGEGTVTKDPDQTEYAYNSSVNLTANPAEGWKFVEWQGDISTTENPVQITVDEAKEVTAVFEKKSFAVTINVEGEGSVTLSPDQDEYTFSSEIELTANPDPDWEFSEWSGDISESDNPLTLTVNNALSITAIFSNTTFAGGSGTEENPYKISTLEQLQAINEYPDAHFIQTNDIDAIATKDWNEGKGFKPIGDDIIKFTGSYFGDQHTIQNVIIDRPNSKYIGLFGYIDDGAKIKNLNLKTIKVNGDFRVGGLVGNVGFNSGIIEQIYVNGDISGYGYIGGLVGYNRGQVGIQESYSSGSVSGTAQVGGLVGDNRGPIKSSYSEADVTGTNFVGGLVGFNFRGDIENSKASCNVKGTEEVGGLAGKNNEGSIYNSYAQGKVEGDVSVGGLVGVNEGNGGTIEISYSAGSISGTTDVGGLVGTNGAEIKTSYWDINISNQTEGVGRGSSDDTKGLSTSEMTGSAAKDNMTGFDFNEIWATSNNYPVLFWE